MKRMLSTSRIQAAIGTVAVGGALAVAAISAAPAVAAAHKATAQAASSSVLEVESSPVTSINGYNPFVATSASVTVGATSMIYEPLFQADTLKPGTYYPFLATHYKWNKTGTELTFTIRQGVKWSDGQPFTAADVAFTYNLIKANPSINNTGIALSGVSTSGNTVTLKFASPQFANFENIAATVYIVPQHIWSSVGNPATYADNDPIGTGPYTVNTTESSPTTGIVLNANPNYWGGPWNVGGGAPAVKTVEFPTLSTNTTALTALIGDQVDWAGNFIAGVHQAFAGKPLVFWSPPLNTNSLEPNLSEWPTNQLAVRQAISAAINRTAISTQGEGGEEPVAVNASGLTLPVFNQYLAPVAKKFTLSPKADPAKAEAILKAAGYKKNSQGWFALHGKVVKVTITDPSGYSDYALDDSLIAGQLKKAGIDASFDGLSVNAWSADMADGDFQLTMHWSQTSVSPYQLYDDWLNSALATKTNRAGDFEGLKSPVIDADLKTLAAAGTTAAQVTALAPIESWFANNLPVIPTVYGVSWGEYNTGTFTGWPTPSNDYETAQPAQPTNEVVVLHLKPAS